MVEVAFASVKSDIRPKFQFHASMPITPADARRLAKNHVVKQKAVSSDAKVRVSDFGKLADGSYSVLVDVTAGKDTTRYRVKMDKNGKIQSLVTR